MTYAELAAQLEAHDLKETEASISKKPSLGTIAAIFFQATLAALECDGVRLVGL